MNNRYLHLLRGMILSVLMGVVYYPAFAQVDTLQNVVPNRKNSIEQQKKPYVILISLDGFRYDYVEKHNATHIRELGNGGVHATAMMPSYPSLTFPNHYTLVTGLYPAHHGLVNNSFYDKSKNTTYSMSQPDKVRDSSWYGGTPLWSLAEQQKMVSASLFWVGSEAAVKGLRPSYYYNYTEKIPMSRRIEIVKEWLSLPADVRPHLVTFYLSEPDHSGHGSGPDAPETKSAVQMADSVVFALTQAVAELHVPVNFVLVSDHGMTAVDQEHPLEIPAVVDPAKWIIPASGTIVELYAKNPDDILPVYNELKKVENHFTAYLKKDMPAYMHYGTADDVKNRIGDILLLPEWPMVFSKRKPSAGAHGFDPTKVPDMKAIFYAWGPAFKKNVVIPPFQNIHVYPLVADILGLKITDPIDGNPAVLRSIKR